MVKSAIQEPDKEPSERDPDCQVPSDCGQEIDAKSRLGQLVSGERDGGSMITLSPGKVRKAVRRQGPSVDKFTMYVLMCLVIVAA